MYDFQILRLAKRHLKAGFFQIDQVRPSNVTIAKWVGDFPIAPLLPPIYWEERLKRCGDPPFPRQSDALLALCDLQGCLELKVQIPKVGTVQEGVNLRGHCF